jgi:uncharacterized membrane protein (DUF485 family)
MIGMRIWTLFWLFVVVSWSAVGFYLFISGWTSCAVTGTCITDGFVVLLALLLMPAQVLLAVYLKQRRVD